ncbi:hypothetical protein [Hansschlegelia zhihuaiae]|uniref:DUF1833 domain-containing protein n=1 Tax=Hansschlegelia zhihuaiae TaxID=405005 RepID=A0A4Q0MNI5_9HYPH|nr:hypothetical protein [Hansschlegelia zhihuaiae]RXF75085.1 hypothetical protein EK403_03285 [Hansschlegelia zhihuaiae]
MTTPSERAHEMMTAESSAEATVDFLTFTHASLGDPIRLCNHKTEIKSVDGPVTTYWTRSREAGRVGGELPNARQEFDYLPFAVVWPGYEEGATPEIRIAIDMVDRTSILGILRVYREGRVKCLVESALASDPDIVDFRFRGFYLRRAPWDGIAAQLGLQLTPYDQEPYPVGFLGPSVAPGLFP